MASQPWQPVSYHTCALTSSGGVKCWGDNDYGELGDGTNTDRLTPVGCERVIDMALIDIDAGMVFTCAATSTGGVRCWGRMRLASSEMAQSPIEIYRWMSLG